MAHEKEREQYKEDAKKHGKDAYKLWEYRYSGLEWYTCSIGCPDWCPSVEYRRKEQPFEPEYFSGLNWREAEKLVGKVVEFSDDGDSWYGPYLLKKLNERLQHRFCAYRNMSREDFIYIRTCFETYKHPTITIGGVELPRPEAESPRCGGMIWVFTPFHPDGYYGTTYQGYGGEEIALKRGFVHLAEDRAQAWADWWKEKVIAAIKR